MGVSVMGFSKTDVGRMTMKTLFACWREYEKVHGFKPPDEIEAALGAVGVGLFARACGEAVTGGVARIFCLPLDNMNLA